MVVGWLVDCLIETRSLVSFSRDHRSSPLFVVVVVVVVVQWSVGFFADTIFVTFRGTINAMDLVIDLSVVPAPLVGSGGSTDIMVPSGMLASVVWEEPYIIAAINGLIESRLSTNRSAQQRGHGFSKIVFAGHSLGGGLATVCALRFVDLHHFMELKRVVRTFGAPQVRFFGTPFWL